MPASAHMCQTEKSLATTAAVAAAVMTALASGCSYPARPCNRGPAASGSPSRMASAPRF